MTATKEIKKAAVIGAGVMGAPIAALMANAGIEVLLLDIVPKDAKDRNMLAAAALDRMKKASLNPSADPLSGAFLTPSNAKMVKIGNTEDNWDELKDADWIIEVVKEDINIKRRVFENIEKVRKQGAIVSSNTSTIPLEDLCEGRSADFKQNFVISHFFNPPRFMRLLEIISGKDTDPAALKAISTFGDLKMGKDVVICKDTPGFKGNRIGVYMLLTAIVEAVKAGLKPEEADEVLGRPVGFEKSGIFGTLDVVGLDTIPNVVASMAKKLPASDPFHAVYKEAIDLGILDRMNQMVQDGYSGRKGKGGFFRPKKDADGKSVKDAKGKTVLESVDIKTGVYSDVIKPDMPAAKNGKKGIKAVIDTNDKGGQYAWKVLSSTMIYAAGRIPEISDDLHSVDLAMRAGFKWKRGPFEMIDAIGVQSVVARAQTDGLPIPAWLDDAAAKAKTLYKETKSGPQDLSPDGTYKAIPTPEGVLRLSDVKRGQKPLLKGNSASAWDIGDGVVCFEFHSLMNTIDPSTLLMLNNTIKMINDSKDKYKALVIHNEGQNFSAGANLGFAQLMIRAGLWNVVEDMVYYGQSVYNALRYAPFPVVGAPKGLALGGGCEILLHCDAVQADAETYMGLVEVGVGVIPGWNGCARTLERTRAMKGMPGGPMPAVRAAFQQVMMPQNAMSTSGPDAIKKLWLGKKDGVTMNTDRLLADAKAKALSLVPGYTPPTPSVFNLPGQAGKASIASAIEEMAAQGIVTKHDAKVANALADTLTGGDVANHTSQVTEDDLAYLERRNFISLIRTKETQKRIDVMLKSGKPYREKEMADVDTMRDVRKTSKVFNVSSKPLKREPLKGWDAVKLRSMAVMTWGMYKALGLKKK